MFSVLPSSQVVSVSTLKEAVCLSLARSGFTEPRTEPCEYLPVSRRAILEAELGWEGMGLVRCWHPCSGWLMKVLGAVRSSFSRLAKMFYLHRQPGSRLPALWVQLLQGTVLSKIGAAMYFVHK